MHIIEKIASFLLSSIEMPQYFYIIINIIITKSFRILHKYQCQYTIHCIERTTNIVLVLIATN